MIRSDCHHPDDRVAKSDVDTENNYSDNPSTVFFISQVTDDASCLRSKAFWNKPSTEPLPKKSATAKFGALAKYLIGTAGVSTNADEKRTCGEKLKALMRLIVDHEWDSLGTAICDRVGALSYIEKQNQARRDDQVRVSVSQAYKTLSSRCPHTISTIHDVNQCFAQFMTQNGHALVVDKDAGINTNNSVDNATLSIRFRLPFVAASSREEIETMVKKLSLPGFSTLRGPRPGDRGTFRDAIQSTFEKSGGMNNDITDPSLLCEIFRRQAARWRYITFEHMRQVIVWIWLNFMGSLKSTTMDKAVHAHFIRYHQTAFETAFSNLKHADCIIQAELSSQMVTTNLSFKRQLAWFREKHDSRNQSGEDSTSTQPRAELDENAVNEIQDIVTSYYEVARERFVDAICVHVIEFYLLCQPRSPLLVTSPENTKRIEDHLFDWRICGPRDEEPAELVKFRIASKMYQNSLKRTIPSKRKAETAAKGQKKGKAAKTGQGGKKRKPIRRSRYSDDSEDWDELDDLW